MNDKSKYKGVKGVDTPAPDAVAAPVVNSPAPDGNVENPVEFSGTGEEGWLVLVYSVPTNGQPIASAYVKNGKWSTSVNLDVRRYSAFALQQDNRESSEWTAIFDFNVTG
ncbi:hypothetical protein [Pseudomonas sp. LB3P38]|uniref:hypothetical protein n=1 Tax=Pseudomonas lyxosi TaxID=3398358 RepID=UPI0039F0D15E